MITSNARPHRTRKEWQNVDSQVIRILDALDAINPHSKTSMYCWLKSGKGYHTYRGD